MEGKGRGNTAQESGKRTREGIMSLRVGVKKYVLIVVAVVLFAAGSVGATSVTWFRDTYGHDAWYSVGSGWSYQYVTTTATGYWKDGTYGRLAYNYNNGQWWHCSSAWATLGGTGGPTEFIGDGGVYALASGWYYRYVASSDTGYWRDGSAWRLAYGYVPRQWWHTRTVWTRLGNTGTGPSFIGNGAYWTVGGGWQYKYVSNTDTGYWKNSSNHQFAYSYNPGLWWDYTGSTWGRLGLDGQSEQFIADGQNRPFSQGDYFRYDGSYYYWRTGSTDYYRYEYATGQWSAHQYDGSWSTFVSTGWLDPDLRYIGRSKYVARGREADPGAYAPAGNYDVEYNVWLASQTSFRWTFLTSWTIHRPGSDNKWSGGPLNVLWAHSPDFCVGLAEYTIVDTLVFKYDMTSIGLNSMVDWLGYVRDYFRQNISTVAFIAHGNETGWNIGEWISTSNYAYYQAAFLRWGTYMTGDGQIISYHCSVGNAISMLDEIAAWTGCEIFAHNHDVWAHWYWVSGSGYDSSVWNHNYRYFRLRKDEYGSPDTFEYLSNPLIAARIIVEEREW